MTSWLAWGIVVFGAALTLIGTYLVDQNAKHEIAEAQRETSQIKAQLAWRLLTDAQASAMRPILLGSSHPVTIVHVAGDAESLYLAKQIGDLFSACGWLVRHEEHTYGGDLVFGFFVPGPESPAVVAARQALTSANIAFSTTPPPEATMELTPDDGVMPSGSALIVVGTKRPSLLGG